MSPPESKRPPGMRARILLVLAAVVSVVVPLQFWNQTWFGRKLTNQEIETYLHDSQHPRKIQHALSQMAGRMIERDPAVSAWYPEVAALARSPLTELRTTAAWVMGQDNRSESFHKALLSLLGDSELMVRRNAALALVRFGDDAGRAELLRALLPWTIQAPARGRLRIRLDPGQAVRERAMLARIQSGEGREIEVRSPASGLVSAVFAPDNSQVDAGQRLLALRSEPEEVWEALRGLYLVGQHEDLTAVEQYARMLPEVPEHIRRQATMTARAIRTRSEPYPIR